MRIPFSEQVTMPVNYHARFKGLFVQRFLEPLDNFEEQHPGSSRPITHVLRTLDTGDAVIIEGLLWNLLVAAYRKGLLP